MNLTEKEQADKLRRLARLRTPKRYPYIGDIVEVQKTDFKNDDLRVFHILVFALSTTRVGVMLRGLKGLKVD